jgi:hypothetical protein
MSNFGRFSIVHGVSPFNLKGLHCDARSARERVKRRPTGPRWVGWRAARRLSLHLRPHSRKGRKGSKERKEKTAGAGLATHAALRGHGDQILCAQRIRCALRRKSADSPAEADSASGPTGKTGSGESVSDSESEGKSQKTGVRSQKSGLEAGNGGGNESGEASRVRRSRKEAQQRRVGNPPIGADFQSACRIPSCPTVLWCVPIFW